MVGRVIERSTSPEEGVLYNRRIVEGLITTIHIAYQQKPTAVAFGFIERSVQSPHSKIWIFNEKDAFDEAAEETLNPSRWVENGATRGCRVPLPTHLTIDLKGSFLNPETGELFIDCLKLERPCDLHRKGYT
jgi:hypothetical protein